MTRATRPTLWMLALLIAVTTPVAALAQDTFTPHHVARLKSVAPSDPLKLGRRAARLIRTRRRAAPR